MKSIIRQKPIQRPNSSKKGTVEFVLNCECNLSKLRIHANVKSGLYGYLGCGEISVGEFVDIELILDRDIDGNQGER